MPTYHSVSGSVAEDLFIELFSEAFGAEKAGYLYSQYHFYDIYQKNPYPNLRAVRQNTLSSLDGHGHLDFWRRKSISIYFRRGVVYVCAARKRAHEKRAAQSNVRLSTSRRNCRRPSRKSRRATRRSSKHWISPSVSWYCKSSTPRTALRRTPPSTASSLDSSWRGGSPWN